MLGDASCCCLCCSLQAAEITALYIIDHSLSKSDKIYQVGTAVCVGSGAENVWFLSMTRLRSFLRCTDNAAQLTHQLCGNRYGIGREAFALYIVAALYEKSTTTATRLYERETHEVDSVAAMRSTHSSAVATATH